MFVPLDPLTLLLRSFAFENVVVGPARLSAPYGVRAGGPGRALLYVVQGAPVWFETPGHGGGVVAERAEAGDVVLIPGGREHVFSDAPGRPAVGYAELPYDDGPRHGPRTTTWGGGGARADVLVGVLDVGSQTSPFVRTLPPVVVARRDSPGLRAVIVAIVEEAERTSAGSRAVLGHLFGALVVQALRAHVAAPGRHARGWIAGLLDPHVGPALAAAVEAPERPWTVAALAREAALSRAAFSARFRAVVGQTPAAALTEWRLHVAAGWLSGSERSLASVAEQAGYGSASAFSRAFVRWSGTTPGDYRSTRTGQANQGHRPDASGLMSP